MRLNPQWVKTQEDEIAAFKLAQGLGTEVKPIDVTTSINAVAQFMIHRLSLAGIGFRLIQLGAGVKRVTTDTHVCPKCNGTGRC